MHLRFGQGEFKIGARTAVSARSWLPIKFARTRLSALLSRYFLNPPCGLVGIPGGAATKILAPSAVSA